MLKVKTYSVVSQQSYILFITQKRKKGDTCEDSEYRPGGKAKKRVSDTSSSSEEASEEEEEEEESLKWSTPEDTDLELDSDGSEYCPMGRNAKRVAKRQGKNELVLGSVYACGMSRIMMVF